MKSEEQILEKIENINNEIEELHKERTENKKKYGGVSEEYNADFFSSLHHLNTELSTLEWVLSKKIL